MRTRRRSIYEIIKFLEKIIKNENNTRKELIVSEDEAADEGTLLGEHSLGANYVKLVPWYIYLLRKSCKWDFSEEARPVSPGAYSL